MKIKDLLNIKNRQVVTIEPDETVLSAMQKLVDHNIGALPVCDKEGKMLGIVSERDLLKECCRRSDQLKNTKVKDVMTTNVAVGIHEDEIDYIMNIMSQKQIRHLPIMEGGKLDNIISVRDVVEVQLVETTQQVRWLNDYILGSFGNP